MKGNVTLKDDCQVLFQDGLAYTNFKSDDEVWKLRSRPPKAYSAMSIRRVTIVRG